MTARPAAKDGATEPVPATPCPYLPDRLWSSEAYWADALDGATYERLMSRFFRRSGRIVYRPRCDGCTECRPIRVPVERFRPTRSMRRVWSRNLDLRVEATTPAPSDEKFDLFVRYLDVQHDATVSRTYDAFVDFLYDHPMEALEFTYRAGRRIVAVGITDRAPCGLSSVYTYFDPDERARSPGTYSALWEIDHCRNSSLPYYYLGYYVAGARTMAYKARFRPNEILAGDDLWVPFRD